MKTGINFFKKVFRKFFKPGFVFGKKKPVPNISDNNYIFGENVEFFNSTIGDYSYISSGSKVQYSDISKFCSIGPNVIIGYGDHPIKFLSTSPLFYYGTKFFNSQIAFKDYFDHHKRVTIKNDVWIGASVYIKNGITIGNGAVIASGAVIINDVPDYAIVGGVPGKILKYRFSNNVIAELIKLKWWNWEIEKLTKYHSMFVTDNIEECLEELKAHS